MIGPKPVSVATRPDGEVACEMRCPFCEYLEDRVLDSRVVRDGEAIRRRRECLQCSRRFTTFELVEERRLIVVKKDGRREPFERGKLLRGLELACRKRPVGTGTVERLADRVERELYNMGEVEVQASVIGERVIDQLRSVDPVAYVRFASVYRDFQDLSQFQDLLSVLRVERKKAGKRPSRKAGQRSPARAE